jgi:hypothetical protein
MRFRPFDPTPKIGFNTRAQPVGHFEPSSDAFSDRLPVIVPHPFFPRIASLWQPRFSKAVSVCGCAELRSFVHSQLHQCWPAGCHLTGNRRAGRAGRRNRNRSRPGLHPQSAIRLCGPPAADGAGIVAVDRRWRDRELYAPHSRTAKIRGKATGRLAHHPEKFEVSDKDHAKINVRPQWRTGQPRGRRCVRTRTPPSTRRCRGS